MRKHEPILSPRQRPAVPARQKRQKPSARADSISVLNDPADFAKAAGLRYVTDHRPGISRKRYRANFRYILPDGSSMKDADTLARIKSLAIPPAWEQVWICKEANGHLQATGRDARGRKQSRYHPKWRAIRDENKYERMAHFAEALPGIRARVHDDLGLHGMPRNKVLATIVSLMEVTHIRVGNTEYARENQSYGLTTMRDEHVNVHGSEITFSFQGKSRVHHTIQLHDRRLARIILQCEEIPGHELFQYVDHSGDHHVIDSQAVNDYLREITGQHFTAKDFRTWHGTVMAAKMLHEFEPFRNVTEAKRNIVAAIKQVASELGNTPSVCRKCYVHPAVIEAYMGGMTKQQAREELEERIAERAEAVSQATSDSDAPHGLHEEERALINLLQQRMLLEAAA